MATDDTIETIHVEHLLASLDAVANALAYLGDEDGAAVVMQARVVICSLHNLLADLQDEDLEDYLEHVECEGEA